MHNSDLALVRPTRFSSIPAYAFAALALVAAGCSDADIDSSAEVERTGEAAAPLTWGTSDVFNYGGKGAGAAGVAIGPGGDIIVVGYRVEANGTYTWLARTSGTNGASWTGNGTYKLSDGPSNAADVAIDGAGRIFAAGSAEDVNGKRHWIVLKGTVSGGAITWTTSDDYQSASGDAWGKAIAVDSNNVVYAGGYANEVWKVRRSTNNGGSWTEVDSVTGALAARAYGLCVLGNTVYATGYKSNAYFPHDPKWLVRKSTGGGPWSDADTFGSPSQMSEAYSCGVNAGKVYVAGNYTNTATTTYNWLLREGTTSGTWTTIEDIPGAPGGYDAAGSARSASNGDLYVAGTHSTSATLETWHVRKRDGVTGVWSDSDDFTLPSGGHAGAAMIKYAPATGSTFVVGGAVDSAGVTNWVVRKL